MVDLNLLYEAILTGKHNVAMELTQEAIDENVSPKELIDNYLIKAMEEIGRRFEAHQAFVPELLMAGDLHDIGKNLVGSMFEGCGFQVVDLGVDVDAEKFVQAVKEYNARIIGLSALLTTTMPYMRTVIDALQNEGLRERVIVMVGGAPVSAAAEIGADGYSDSANSAVFKAKELLGVA